MENLDDVNIQDEAPKRPNFLVFLLVLTSISLVLMLYSTVQGLIEGPKSPEFMEELLAEQSEQIAEAKSVLGEDGMLMEAIESSMELAKYQNNEVFYSYHIWTFLQVLLGIAAVVFMFKLRKIGFHLYVAYSVLPIIISYLLFPLAYLSNFMIFGSILIAGLFCLLYGLNLKHMK